MKKVYTKPVALYIPLVEGMDARCLNSLSHDELAGIVIQCKEAQALRIYQQNPDVLIRNVGDEWVMVPTGEFAQRFNGMISLNIFSQFVWQQFEQPHSVGDVLQAAHAQFEDPNHMLDVQVRKLISDFARMGLLLKE